MMIGTLTGSGGMAASQVTSRPPLIGAAEHPALAGFAQNADNGTMSDSAVASANVLRRSIFLSVTIETGKVLRLWQPTQCNDLRITLSIYTLLCLSILSGQVQWPD